MKLLIPLASVMLSACATTQDADIYREQVAALAKAERAAAVELQAKQDCDRAWAETKIFALHSSDMKTQTSDDAIYVSHNPTKYGLMSISATRSPSGENGCVIKLMAYCKGQSDIAKYSFGPQCRSKMIDAYTGFSSKVGSVAKVTK